MLVEALAAEQTIGEGFYTAELHRLRGELLLQAGARHPQVGEAEPCFGHARDLARHRQAKALELRTTVSLSRLWQRQGKRAEARDLLAPVYGWFTEGFDTADLQDARALLETLK